MNIFLKPRRGPMVIAHRGANKVAPENTRAAFAQSVIDQADAIELDVQLSRDGKLVVIHDTTVNRTTNGRGKVVNLSYEQLALLDAGDHETIPKLADILDEFAGKIGIVIELKNYTTPRDGLSTRVAKLIAEKNATDSVMFGSFMPWSLRAVRKVLPDAVTCVFYFPFTGWLSLPWRRYINVLGPHEKAITKARVRQMHRHGKLANAWVIDTAKDAHLMARDGVNMITTDDVPLVRNALSETSSDQVQQN